MIQEEAIKQAIEELNSLCKYPESDVLRCPVCNTYLAHQEHDADCGLGKAITLLKQAEQLPDMRKIFCENCTGYEPKAGQAPDTKISVLETLDKIYEAGGKVWDEIPEAEQAEPPPAISLKVDEMPDRPITSIEYAHALEIALRDCRADLSAMTKTADDFATEKALKEQLLDWENREGAVCPEDVGFEEYIKALNERIEKLEKQRWVSISERLPERLNFSFWSEWVAATDGEEWTIARYDYQYSRWETDHSPYDLDIGKITHWMEINPEQALKGVNHAQS